MIDPNAPQPAASVGVAKPKSILPKAEKTKSEDGTNHMKNSYKITLIFFSLSP